MDKKNNNDLLSHFVPKSYVVQASQVQNSRDNKIRQLLEKVLKRILFYN